MSEVETRDIKEISNEGHRVEQKSSDDRRGQGRGQGQGRGG